MSPEHFVGVDVSKDKLDVAVYPANQLFNFVNEQSGLDELVQSLQEFQPLLIVFESTGGYKLLAVTTLCTAELPVVIINDRRFLILPNLSASWPKPIRLMPRLLLTMPVLLDLSFGRLTTKSPKKKQPW